jgi:DNA adenine methylase
MATKLTPALRPLVHEVDSEELLRRAKQTLSAVPRPFLRWAGSKQRLLRQLVPLLPDRFNRYYEPFLGAGSLFFLLQPSAATISDSCPELMRSYEAVRANARDVLDHLGGLDPLDKDQYYRVRKSRSKLQARQIAEFLYLNKAAWNGLYRVNSRGEFNVPYGAPETSFIADESNLLSCATLLRRRNVSIRTCDFESALRRCRAGDFVFLDPPYVTGHNNNGFIDYNEQLFSWSDQIRLSEVARDLATKGVLVMVTNANHQAIVDLYDGFDATPISRSSTLAGDKGARRMVSETVLRSFL